MTADSKKARIDHIPIPFSLLHLAAMAASAQITFRTLAGVHTIDVLPLESNQVAIARDLKVDPRRIAIHHHVDDELFVVVIDPIRHDPLSDTFKCPPGFMQLYKQNIDRLDWGSLSRNPGVIELLRENVDRVDLNQLSRNPRAAADLLSANRDKINRCKESPVLREYDLLMKLYRGKVLSELSSTRNRSVEQLLSEVEHADWQSAAASSSADPIVIALLAQNLDKVDWYWLSLNPSPHAIGLLSQNVDNIDWNQLSLNPNAMDLLSAHVDKVHWKNLSSNPSAINLLAANLKKVNWSFLSLNPQAIDLLTANMDKIDWVELSRNPNALGLITSNLDKIHWRSLSTNPAAISLLERNLDKVNWYELSRNPCAAELLAANPDHVEWFVCCNPFEWFEYGSKAM